MKRNSLVVAVSAGIASTFATPLVFAQEAEPNEFSVTIMDDFEENRDFWEWLDPNSWQYAVVDDRRVMSQSVRKPSYDPPHRSPHHVALVKEPEVSDFELTVSVRSTVKDYGHRDVCLFFGFVDPAHFYYVHLGKKTDANSNQVFVVNGADRKSISTSTTEGTPWTDEWHRVKLARNVESGSIEVFFDDFDKPSITAEDKTFPVGRVGVGSFDDTADWDDFELRAVAAKSDDSPSPAE